MHRPAPAALILALLLTACGDTEPTASQEPTPNLAKGGLVPKSIPDEDPGPPFYARVGAQILSDGDWVAIPFYRPPACVPADFNLLLFYHFPGPGGPGAFACPINVTGTLLIEPDAPLGTFPRQVNMRGDNVPVWFVPQAVFMAAASDGVLTVAELEGLSPLKGTATRFHEMLQPRDENHKIVITSGGELEDGRRFTFNLTHLGTEIVSIRIMFR